MDFESDEEAPLGRFQLQLGGSKRTTPYLFEPTRPNRRNVQETQSSLVRESSLNISAATPAVTPEEEHPVEVEARSGHTRWCLCGNCAVMTRKAELFCCQESPPAMALMPQGTTCACDLKDFEAVVRSRSVLIVFLRTCREFRGGGINEGNNR